MTSPSTIDAAKEAAAYRAVEDHLHASYRYIGIGSGTTVIYVVKAIASRGSAFYSHMRFIPTSSQSKGLITAAGLPLCNLDERPLSPEGLPEEIDIVFDGADQVDDDLNCIKGGGACLFQEKLVNVAAKKFILVGDHSKLAARLCMNGRAIPLEILPLSAPDILRHLQVLGCLSAVVRSGKPSKAGPCITDNGMWIIDVLFSPLLLTDLQAETPGTGPGSWEVGALARVLCQIPGIVETGLFCNANFPGSSHTWLSTQPSAAYFGMTDGHVLIRKSPSV